MAAGVPRVDAHVRVVDGLITLFDPVSGFTASIDALGRLAVTGGGGGGGGGVVDQGLAGVQDWVVTDAQVLAALVALGAFLTAAPALTEAPIADGDDLAAVDLLHRGARLWGWDGAGWDRLLVKYGGLEARDDYATFEPQRATLDPATDTPFTLPADTRLVRITNWSTTQRVHVSPAVITATGDDCAFVGVAPATNLSNSEVFPVRLAEVHLWADGAAEVTVEAFRGP